MVKLEDAQEQYQTFIGSFDSVMLGTVDEEGFPNASYTPFVVSEDKKFYVYISTMSVHTRNIKNNQKLSIMFIEDECKSTQIFARRRLTFTCDVKELIFESSEFEVGASLLSKKFGAIISNFKGMADFSIFEITPKEGRFVIGFGAAYMIKDDDLNTLIHMGGKGHGHHKRSSGDEKLEDVKQGMIIHMNEDHAEAVLNIVKIFAGEKLADKATLKDIKEDKLIVIIRTLDNEKTIEVPLASKIANGGDAHKVLISMAKESRMKLENKMINAN